MTRDKFTVTSDELASASALGPAIAAEVRAQLARSEETIERSALDRVTSDPPPIPYPDATWWERMIRRPLPADFAWTPEACRQRLVDALTEFYAFNGYHQTRARAAAEVLSGPPSRPLRLPRFDWTR